MGTKASEISRNIGFHYFNPDCNTTYTNFSQKYVTYLLPSLLKATTLTTRNSTQIQKIVRSEVDMAFALSSKEFKWGRVLHHKLNSSKITKSELSSQYYRVIDKVLSIPRPIYFVDATYKPRKITRRRVVINKKVGKCRDDEHLGSRLRALQGIMPGGKEMDLFELLSEVQTYIVCLQLQVNVLRSLVDE